GVQNLLSELLLFPRASLFRSHTEYCSLYGGRKSLSTEFQSEVREAAETDRLCSMADREVAFSGESLSYEQLTSLPENIERLTIWGGPITNHRLAPLSRLTSLQSLVLGE